MIYLIFCSHCVSPIAGGDGVLCCRWDEPQCRRCRGIMMRGSCILEMTTEIFPLVTIKYVVWVLIIDYHSFVSLLLYYPSESAAGFFLSQCRFCLCLHLDNTACVLRSILTFSIIIFEK